MQSVGLGFGSSSKVLHWFSLFLILLAGPLPAAAALTWIPWTHALELGLSISVLCWVNSKRSCRAQLALQEELALGKKAPQSCK